ncbi:hypothetical protein [Streptomyces sp. MBT27]|uniref:hypothetical protein n=1 Tax=Streptomyces sp. MBT27 TaxID=1488356 RepID=UPI00196633E1|nr:hypothetical protein [Streptomyces sp. MBT27]
MRISATTVNTTKEEQTVTTIDINDVAVLATAGILWGTLAVGHNLADHVAGQTDAQAAAKGAPTPAEVDEGVSPRRGWGACLRHVAQYHLVLAALVAVTWAVLPLHLTPAGIGAALAVSISTHAFFDRRWPVRWILEHTGSPEFAQLNAGGLNGMYLADQALHHLALFAAAVLMARL